MQVVNSIYNIMPQGVQKYLDEIPTNTGRQMLYGAGAGFIVETIFTGNPSKGAIAAALSALATAIYGLVTPLFKEIVGSSHLSWGEEMCRTFTAIIGAGCVAAAFGNSSILNKLGFLAVLWGFITYVDPSRRDLSRADWIVLFPSYGPSI